MYVGLKDQFVSFSGIEQCTCGLQRSITAVVHLLVTATTSLLNCNCMEHYHQHLTAKK